MGFSDMRFDLGKVASEPDASGDLGRNAELSGEKLDEAYRLMLEQRKAEERASAARRAHVATTGSFDDGAGTLWGYAVIDGTEARILSVASAVEELAIPASVAGVPVTSIGSDIGHDARACRMLTIPASVTAIEPCAFRQMKGLERLVLPPLLDSFDPSWVRGCANLHDLTLPGMVRKLDAGVFSEGALERLRIGRGTAELAPGMFEKSRLAEISVDPANPELKTDGCALYSADGGVLIALCLPRDRFTVPAGVRKIAKKAFWGRTELAAVELPDSLRTVGKFGFAKSGLVAFRAPQGLRRIGERAFFNCRALVSAEVGPSLETIEADAFTSTGIDRLRLPATVTEIGLPVAQRTKLVYGGAGATFTIDGANPCYRLDREGGLYETRGGTRFVRLLDEELAAYEVQTGTEEIAPEAFCGCTALESVRIPAGVRIIGAGAFRGCGALRRAELPDTVESIGGEAFMETALESLRVSPRLASLGERALVTLGAYRGRTAPQLTSVEIAPGNERFFVESDLLCERVGSGMRVIAYLGNDEAVVLPDRTVEVAPYAFAGARRLRSLTLSTAIRTVGIRAFRLEEPVAHVKLVLEEPIGDRRSFDLPFPETERGLREIVLALGSRAGVDPATVLAHYDNAILNPSDFETVNENGLGRYEQARLLLRRLADPVLMEPKTKELCERALRTDAEEICLDIARHGDRETMDLMVDEGYLNEDNIDRIVERVGSLQDASMTGHLLEIKRRRFGRAAFDFSL